MVHNKHVNEWIVIQMFDIISLPPPAAHYSLKRALLYLRRFCPKLLYVHWLFHVTCVAFFSGC